MHDVASQFPRWISGIRAATEAQDGLRLRSPSFPDRSQIATSAEGTSTQGSSGDAYATAIYMAIRKNWNTPAGLVTDTELQGLLAEVHISIGEDGTLSNPQVRKSSGNQYFDESCLQAIHATGKVPTPPADQRARFQYGAMREFSGKDLAR